MPDQILEFLAQNLQVIVLSLNLASVFLILAVVFSYFRRNKTGENLILELAEDQVRHLKSLEGSNPDSKPDGKSKEELQRFKPRSQSRGRKQ